MARPSYSKSLASEFCTSLLDALMVSLPGMDAAPGSRPARGPDHAAVVTPRRTLLELAVYDGSDNGEKIYDTLTVIGHGIAPDDNKPADATAGQQAFRTLTRWPVTISYFDHAAAEKSGEQTPVYAITFELYENGVSRALILDYGDFVLHGEMTSVEMKDEKPCP